MYIIPMRNKKNKVVSGRSLPHHHAYKRYRNHIIPNVSRSSMRILIIITNHTNIGEGRGVEKVERG